MAQANLMLVDELQESEPMAKGRNQGLECLVKRCTWINHLTMLRTSKGV